MKKSYLSMLAVIMTVCLVMMSFVACGSQTGEESQDGQESEAGAVFSIENVEDKGSEEYMEWDFQLPKLSGTPAAEEIAARLDAGKEALMKTARGTAEEIAVAVQKGDAWGANMSAYSGARWDYTQQGNVVTILVNWSTYLGGAHGDYNLQTITFTVDDGKIYGFDDIFKNAEGGKFVRDYVSSLIAENPDNYFETAPEDVKNFNDDQYNFFFNGENLYIAYNPYSIAAYAAGIVSFEIPFEDIEQYLDEGICDFVRGCEKKTISEYVFTESAEEQAE